MNEMAPVLFMWTEDGVMKPQDRFSHLCDRQFVVGETYRMVVEEERSMASHRQYFAEVNEAWKNLPEHLAPLFPTADKLRKWCLIKCGYATEQSMVCRSMVDAARFATMMGRMNEDSTVVRKGNVIKLYTAKSQSVRHMDKAEFQRSKQDVLDLLASMIGTTTEELSKNAGQAA